MATMYFEPKEMKSENENEHLDSIKQENDSDSETVVKTANNFEMESENEVQHNKNEKHLIVFSVNKPNKSKGNKEKKKKMFLNPLKRMAKIFNVTFVQKYSNEMLIWKCIIGLIQEKNHLNARFSRKHSHN